MADEEKPNQSTDANQDVSKNPDLEKETEGMVDLSDVLATGDNETGAADASDALNDAEKKAAEEVNLFEKNDEENAEIPVEVKASVFDKLIVKLFPEGSLQHKFIHLVASITSKSIKKVISTCLKVKERSLKFLKEDSKNYLEKITNAIKVVLAKFKGELKTFLSLSWKLKVLFVVTITLIGVSLFVLNIALKGELLPGVDKIYVINFNEVADHIYPVGEKDRWEQFRNPIRFPEYVVRLDRLVVMLKQSTFSSSNPMGVFSVYYEASSQEAATEVKMRESEIRDLSARTLEGITYDEIRSFEGKKKAKKALIQSLNKILNQGQLVNVYFKDFVLKP